MFRCWISLMATLGPNDRSWSCLLKLKAYVHTYRKALFNVQFLVSHAKYTTQLGILATFILVREPIRRQGRCHTPGLCCVRLGASKNLGLEHLRRPCRVRIQTSLIDWFNFSEFENAETLLISEVQMLLEHRWVEEVISFTYLCNLASPELLFNLAQACRNHFLFNYCFIFPHPHRKTQNESADDEQELSEVFMKTLNYTTRFSKFKNRETIASVRT